MDKYDLLFGVTMIAPAVIAASLWPEPITLVLCGLWGFCGGYGWETYRRENLPR